MTEAADPAWLCKLRWLDLNRSFLDRAFTVVVLMAIVGTRVVALPGSIWEQDEAYLACGVVDFDIAAYHPHVPGFPLWVALGRIVEPLAGTPELALQWTSLGLAMGGLVALVALWSLVLRRRHAVLAAALVALAPGPWLLSGRAFTGPAAAMVAAAAMAVWLWPGDGPIRRVAGSVLVCAALLIRPHLAPLLAPLVLWRVWVGRRSWVALVQTAGPLVVGLCAGVVVVVVDTGGLPGVVAAVREHADYHFPLVAEFTWRWSELGVVSAVGSGPVAMLWALSVVLGAVVWLAHRETRTVAMVVGGGLVLQTLLLVTAQNPTLPRYAVPLLLLSSGPVVAAWARLGERLVWIVAGGLAALWMVQVLPVLAEYRTTVAPPLAALQAAELEACSRGEDQVLVVDRTLVAFEDLLQTRGALREQLLHEIDLDSGRFQVPPGDQTVLVWDLRRGPPPVDGGQWQLFTVRSPLLRQLAQDRFLDVVVVTDGEYFVP